MEIDDYDIHSNLVEKFIVNCDKVAFRKMLNMDLNSTNNKIEKQRENIIKRQQFLKSMRARAPQHPHFHKDNYYNQNYNTFKKDEISNFRLDLHNFIRDPEYKNKCMKGNYKWAMNVEGRRRDLFSTHVFEGGFSHIYYMAPPR